MLIRICYSLVCLNWLQFVHCVAFRRSFSTVSVIALVNKMIFHCNFGFDTYFLFDCISKLTVWFVWVIMARRAFHSLLLSWQYQVPQFYRCATWWTTGSNVNIHQMLHLCFRVNGEKWTESESNKTAPMMIDDRELTAWRRRGTDRGILSYRTHSDLNINCVNAPDIYSSVWFGIINKK